MIVLADCPCDGNTLDKLLHPAILVALTEGPIHGYRLAERIEQMIGIFGGMPDVSGIYRFLKKMEASGYVASTWQAGDGGHARRLYEITPDGRACLMRWTCTLESYLKAIRNLLNEAKSALDRKPICESSVLQA
jgi:PadR family transcriptional regulator, regulatory protein PadR